MSSLDYLEVKRLLAEALSEPHDARSAILDRASCAAVREEVVALLAEHERDPEFLENSDAAVSIDDAQSPTIGLPEDFSFDPRPDSIAGFQLGEKVGEGGMGAIYAAEQIEPVRRSVAIKFIRSGSATPELRARFRIEYQALSIMNHPGIAQIYDAGLTDEQTPYFVMEYVDGQSLTEFCDSSRASLRQRLELFVTVCRAVQHAHQKGVIHRDLKPSNVLVTLVDGRPSPKIIDFGVAKSLAASKDDGPRTTRYGQFLGTPEYMSPEQSASDDVDTRADVYSLGVILYELLVGELPFDPQALRSSGYAEIQRVLQEVDPPRPSLRLSTATARSDGIASRRMVGARSLRKQVRGDLDWIAMRALRKDRSERYQSASELADDIARQLRGEWVHARPPSVAYRLRKLAVKHRALAGIAFATVATLIVISALYVETRAARQQAERRYREVRELVDSLIFEIHDEIATLPGSTTARERLVARAIQYLESLRDDAREDPSLRTEIGQAYLRIGDAQGHPAGPNLGDTLGALESYRIALEAFRAVAEESNASSRDRSSRDEANRMTAMALDKIGEVSHVLSRTEDAAQSFMAAFEIRKSRYQADSDSFPVRADLARSHNRMGLIAAVSGRLEDALTHYARAISLEAALLEEQSGHEEVGRAYAVNWMWKGTVEVEFGELVAGLESFEFAIERFESLRRAAPQNIRLSRDLSVTYGRYVNALLRADRMEDALRWTETSQRMNREIMAADPFNVDARRQLALGYQRQGAILARSGDAEAALVVYGRAREATQRLRADDPENQSYPRDLWVLSFRLASLLFGQDQIPAAMAEAETALALSASLEKAAPANASYRDFVAQSNELVARVARAAGDVKRADSHLRAAEATYRALIEIDPGNERISGRLERVRQEILELSTQADPQ